MARRSARFLMPTIFTSSKSSLRVHPKKAEVLAKLMKASSALDAELIERRSIVAHASAYGVTQRLRALAVLPFLGLAGVVVDAAQVLVNRSSDSDWGETSPSSTAAPPPNEKS